VNALTVSLTALMRTPEQRLRSMVVSVTMKEKLFAERVAMKKKAMKKKVKYREKNGNSVS
jgi:hypothetical protein